MRSPDIDALTYVSDAKVFRATVPMLTRLGESSFTQHERKSRPRQLAFK